MSSQKSQPVSIEPEPLRNRPIWESCDVPQLSIPNDRSITSILSFVEWALVELTHEDVGAEIVSTSVAGVKRTQYIAIDDVGQRFQKRYFDERLGRHETTVSRETVCDELVSRLTHQSSLGGEVGQNDVDGGQDSFCVKPARELRFQE